MLTKQRQELLLKLLEEKGSITVAEGSALLATSESTVRRDITALDREGKLTKVFGGAVASEQKISAHEYTVAQKSDLNREEKRVIAKYAASMIEPEDFVYIDAGTTTARMIDYIEERSATFVTNAVAHAQRLALLGMKVLLVGGELKASTEAVVGNQAMQTLQSYHFTKGFFGTNGVTKRSGCTTPDANEAMVKRTAMEQCKESYVLCDSSKFGKVSAVTFAPFTSTRFLTEKKSCGYEDSGNIFICMAE
ncbi:DeoR/GlpR family DNA-binding transcription regulator [Lachnospiraceae bacterium 48-42]|jgi:Transcriptional regulators of sugar metabolism|nr:DeoR/GlpR transcriptional regulator [Lachnospiraceae bacterium]